MTKAGNSGLRRRGAGAVRKGVPLLPVNEPETIITLEIVNALRDELVVTNAPPERSPHLG